MQIAVQFSVSKVERQATNHPSELLAKVTTLCQKSFCIGGSAIHFLGLGWHCEEVSAGDFGKRLYSWIELHIREEGASSFEIKQEKLIWERFILSERTPWSGPTEIRFHRPDSHLLYTAIVKGQDQYQLSELCEGAFKGNVTRITRVAAKVLEGGYEEHAMEVFSTSFNHKRRELIRKGFQTKDFVTIKVHLPQSQCLALGVDASAPFHYTEEIKQYLLLGRIDHLVPNYFAFAPSIDTMSLVFSQDGTEIEQLFAKHPTSYFRPD